MKKLKKNLFSLGLAFSLMLGVGFSFVSQNAEAQAANKGELACNESGSIYCCKGSVKSDCSAKACSSVGSEIQMQ
jgi:hypothetical protein